jgi:hypothetical protein
VCALGKFGNNEKNFVLQELLFQKFVVSGKSPATAGESDFDPKVKANHSL